MPGKETVFQQRRTDGDVLAPQAQAVLHRAAGMPDLQFQVPQDVKHRLGDTFGPGGDLPGRQEQQVHVGTGRHLGPAVAAHGQYGQPLRLGRSRVAVRQCGGNGQGSTDQTVGQLRLRSDQRAGLVRARRKGGGEAFGGARPGLGQMAHGHGAALRAVRDDTLGRQVGRDSPHDRCGVDQVGRRRRRVAGGCGRGVRTPRRQSCAERGQSPPPDCSGSARWRGRVRWCRRCAAGRSRSHPRTPPLASTRPRSGHSPARS